MNKLVIEHLTPIEQVINTKDFKSYKSFVISGLEDRFLQGIYDYLKNLKDREYLVISRPEFVESSLPSFEGLRTRLQANIEIVIERPLYINSLHYNNKEIKHNKEIKPIESLSFIERLNFLFTGKYPE